MLFSSARIVLSSACVLAATGPALWAQLQEEDFFYGLEGQVAVALPLDQVGVLAREGVSENAIGSLAERRGLTILRVFPEHLYIMGLSAALPRADLVLYARQLREEESEIVGAAGLVVHPGGDTEATMVLTDQFIGDFAQNVTRAEIDQLNSGNGVDVVMENPFVPNQFLLKVTQTSDADALTMANRYHESPLTLYAHPDFILVIDVRQFIPNDPLFPNQWHHDNTGQSAGTVDADIDTPEAWEMTRGDADVVVAVIDGGFDMSHPDLTPNLWVNAGEIAGNGVDDDGNGFVDDVHGWDFVGCDSSSTAGCGDNDPTGPDTNFGRHGTAVAGTAIARGNNSLGVSGSCPNCSLMPLRIGGTPTSFSNAMAFDYAREMGAAIITNSWGFPINTPGTALTNLVTAINDAAAMGRAARGCVVFFAQNNPNVDDCAGTTPDISSLANVIAVSRATNRDRFDLSGFGNCMDVLAPSAGPTTVSSGRGTLWGTTTDMQGNAGYNDNFAPTACPSVGPAPPPANARDYTFCFNGTSFATPMTAGVAGLVLDQSPSLTRLQVQWLLQDTCDRIEDSAGRYRDVDGYSHPAGGVATHGYGRINAFEAVRVVSPGAGGRNGVDIFLRDNRLDWGNSEQPSNTLFEATRGRIGHWRSVDIKVDAPPYQPAPTSTTFEGFVDETPSARSWEVNKVYVRVRNRGPWPASTVMVKLHWAQFGTALPHLPTDFWSAFPADSADTSQWHPLACTGTASTVWTLTTFRYAGSSLAGTAFDGAEIAQFDFPAPAVDPKLANHFCLLAMIESPQDPISAASRATRVVDDITPNDNNVTHRNYTHLVTGTLRQLSDWFLVRNPFDRSVGAILRLEAPDGWEVTLDPFGFNEQFSLAANEETLAAIEFQTPGENAEGEISIFQEELETGRLMGGVTFVFVPEEITIVFVRGDANDDGNRDISDAVGILGYLFLGGTINDCMDAADVNDDGKLDISDPVRLLGHLFLGEERPPDPYLLCGKDPTEDALSCNMFEKCP